MSEHPTPPESHAVARQIRSKVFLAARAADPNALLPISSRDPVHSARVELYRALRARGFLGAPPWTVAPKAWQSERWPLARAYLTAEIYRTHRTVERCASLAYAAAARLGVAITD